MKQILLLAAIYSLVIHQSRKNSKEASTEIKRSIKKGVSSPGLSNARLFAYNTFRLGSGIPGIYTEDQSQPITASKK